MISLLSAEDGTTLVRIARQAIADHLDGKNFDSVANASSELRAPRGVFVTLFDKARSRRLRGCIGNPFPKTSLVNETMRCAVEAATMDARCVRIRADAFVQTSAG